VDTPFWLDELEAEQIVVATDGSGRGLLPELDDAVWPARGEAVTTEPVGVRLFECPHYARHGFDYWQEVPSRDGTWIAAGYSGHGNVLGLMCGELVASALQGHEDPLLDLFAPPRLLVSG
jgi:glycine/D-amino acid oxidase-like deaminating enzyme